MNAEQRERYRIKAGLLAEPDGHYSFPSIEGSLTSDTGRTEIIGYWPNHKPTLPPNMDDLAKQQHAHYAAFLADTEQETPNGNPTN